MQGSARRELIAAEHGPDGTLDLPLRHLAHLIPALARQQKPAQQAKGVAQFADRLPEVPNFVIRQDAVACA